MPLYQVGDLIERQIESMWFQAVVEGVNLTRRSLKIRYIDDGNIEDGVAVVDCRRVEDNDSSEGKDGSFFESKGFESKWDENASKYDRNNDSGKGVSISKEKQLKKPLAGLVDDDSHLREQHVTKAIIHSCADTEDAIILHGEESRMAAGGGLRALRFLKDKS